MTSIPIFGKDKPYIGDEGYFQESTNTILSAEFKPKEFFHVPNEARRSPKLGAKLKRQGLTSGVSDWFILRPNKKHSGLIIELKVKRTHKSQTATTIPSQRDFLRQMIENGYYGCVCYNIEAFVKIIKDYKNNEL